MKIPKGNKKYSIIYADPPWLYDGGHSLAKNSLLNNKKNVLYDGLSLQDLLSFNINSISEKDCLLFIWASSPKLNTALALIEGWGFTYSTVSFVWYKGKTNPGSYTLSECEICLVARKGVIPKPRGRRDIRQFVVCKRSKLHSKKPNEVRKRIELIFPIQKKIELFARQKFTGWDVWGNEIQSDIEL